MTDREKALMWLESFVKNKDSMTLIPKQLIRLMYDVLKGPQWISVKDRLPVETHSLFWSFYETKEWNKAMWREQSDKVIVAVVFRDGSRIVTTGETHDGDWYTSINRSLEPVVTHWMPLPEPPEEVTGDADRRMVL